MNPTTFSQSPRSLYFVSELYPSLLVKYKKISKTLFPLYLFPEDYYCAPLKDSNIPHINFSNIQVNEKGG